MKRKLRGLKRAAFHLDYSLYRVDVPIPNEEGSHLSVIDIWPEGVERTLLLVHGYGGCAETWEHQINHFSRNYRVVVPDLRGHGQSDAPDSQYTMEELVNDLQAIVEALQLPRRFQLAGHSFGGSVAVEYACAQVERVERLMLISTAGEWPVPRLARWLLRTPGAFLRPWWRFRPRWNAEYHVLQRMMQHNLVNWRGWEKFSQLQTRTLVLTGMRDRYFPRKYFDAVGKQIPGAEILDIGSAKHKVQLERHRAVNRSLSRFLRGGLGSWRERRDEPVAEDQRLWHAAYDENVPHSVPIPRHPLPRFLENTARWLPKRPALICYNQRMSYAELDAKANRLANALLDVGFSAGDRLALLLPNLPSFVIAFYATLKLGGAVVLTNPEAEATALIEQLSAVGARWVAAPSQYAALWAALADVPETRGLLVDLRQELPAAVFHQLAERRRWSHEGQSGFPAESHWLADLVDRAPHSDRPAAEVDLRDTAVIAYTQGAAGPARPVRLSHRNLVANIMQTRHWAPVWRYGRELCLSALPLQHSYPLTLSLNLPIAIGATLVLLPYPDLPTLLEMVRQHRPSMFPAVPAWYLSINQVPNVRRFGFSKIGACLSGLTPLPVEVQESFEKLTRGRILEGYAISEAAPVTHANPFLGQRREGSIGLPLPNTDARIVEIRSRVPLPIGEVGELQIRGPQVSSGYWGEGGTPYEDGWFSTGDLALMDHAGYFRILNRISDAFEVQGETIYPRDVEEVLYEHPDVREVVVVSDPAGADGAQVKAIVLPVRGRMLAEDQLTEWCDRRLPRNAIPQLYEFREELPRTFLGSVLRQKLG